MRRARRAGFRTRLLITLALFAVVPAALIASAAGISAVVWMREFSGAEPWERLAETGREALDVARQQPLTVADSIAVETHQAHLSASLTNARRLQILTQSAQVAAVAIAATALLALGIATAKVAGHLSRQLSRPLQELVGWTEMMARGEQLPEVAHGRGAPEFEVLRQRMRRTARELALGREKALEAERLRAFRETARQVAHELKNPLTPIRFAVERLRKSSPSELSDAVEVLDVETRRMESIARSFSAFGKLPEGPPADIDVGEMVTYTARAGVPGNFRLKVSIEEDLPPVNGHYDSLSRAVSNALLNAVEACGDGGTITVTVRRCERGNGGSEKGGTEGGSSPGGLIEITIEDDGIGIPSDKLAGIWDPYVTYKAAGTGLGLAIARQTIEAHGGNVEASSEVGSGTLIRFQLPVRESGAEHASMARA